jgi:hypothetical protein
MTFITRNRAPFSLQLTLMRPHYTLIPLLIPVPSTCQQTISDRHDTEEEVTDGQDRQNLPGQETQQDSDSRVDERKILKDGHPLFARLLPPHMDTLRIATLNINGLLSPTRQDMPDAFVRLHDIDILLMQEVTNLFTLGFQGYTIHYNIGTSRRGTAILTRDTIVVTTLFRIPS